MSRVFFGVALATVAFLSGPVAAQTTGNGPYYANPSWDQQLPAAQRFILLSNWNNQAVLDRETGLVWQRAPVTATFTWVGAIELCHMNVGVPGLNNGGGRMGWRLPSVEELSSLEDSTNGNFGLPPGNPFQDIQNGDYWTATTSESQFSATSAYLVNIKFGNVDSTDKRDLNFCLCVRGGPSVQAPGPSVQTP